MSRNLILVCTLAFLLLSAGCDAFRAIMSTSREMPAELKTPRAVLGSGVFHKQTLCDELGVGTISQLKSGWPAEQFGAAVVVVGNQGASFVTTDCATKWRNTFEDHLYSPVALVRLNREGGFGFLNRDQSWASDVMLFDQQGKRLWKYNSFTGVDDSAAGDVDGDGKAEFVVGLNGGGGVHLLNTEGKKIWEQDDGNVWHVEIVDAAGDGRGQIIHSSADGALTVRNARGEVVSRRRPASYTADFALTRWGESLTVNAIVIPDEGAIQIASLTGERITRLEAPNMNRFGRIAGTPIHTSPSAPHYATVMNYGLWKRSVLYIHDSRGQLVYQEILGDECGGLTSFSTGETEVLLVGCSEKVWKYSAAPKSSSR